MQKFDEYLSGTKVILYNYRIIYPTYFNFTKENCRDVEINGNIVMKNAQHSFCLLDVELWTGNNELIEWSLTARRLKGYVGYGITTFPFQVDVENYRKFNADTTMIQSWSGVIYGGRTAGNLVTAKRKWKENDQINFFFNPNTKSISMQKVRDNFRKKCFITQNYSEQGRFTYH